ncbi:hypothetical protein Pla108_37090 [Botrimarina colliarenosi]|uniref:Uncharacterized protein n=1 Tax=Botrimarina colliarenosi TaxID=2528001 RepID=A0A5C6A6F3_9BACT|nr:hypothetical protein [Botrimarina colliarenosi]TWT94858.1 hypothetical protein Pla108_37090 [Botrimarina colliarenosi]
MRAPRPADKQSNADTLNRSLATIDGEVGALLTGNDWWQLKSFVGVYGLFHCAIDDTAGVRGRVEARLADQCFVGGYVEHDELFDTTGGVTLEYRFGRGGSAAENSSKNLLARLGDPVVRRRHVLVAENAARLSITSLSVGGPTTGGPSTGGPGVTPGSTVDPEPAGRGDRPTYVPPPRPDDI